MTEPLTAGELLAAAAIIHTRADHGQPHLRALADRLTQAAPQTKTEGSDHGPGPRPDLPLDLG